MINFVVISNKRTGSTFLQQALDSHSNITCYDELFLIKDRSDEERASIPLFVEMKKNNWDIENYVKWIPKKGKTGVKIVYPQLDKWKQLRKVLIKYKIPIIHLIRGNYFEQVMSWYTKGIDYHSFNEPFYIEPSQFLKRVNKVRQQTQQYSQMFKDTNKMEEVYYEQMFGKQEGDKVNIKQKGSFNIISKQKTYLDRDYTKRLCNFLHVKDSDMFSNLTKRTRYNIWDYIKNREEIWEALIDNGFEGNLTW